MVPRVTRAHKTRAYEIADRLMSLVRTTHLPGRDGAGNEVEVRQPLQLGRGGAMGQSDAVSKGIDAGCGAVGRWRLHCLRVSRRIFVRNGLFDGCNLRVWRS